MGQTSELGGPRDRAPWTETELRYHSEQQGLSLNLWPAMEHLVRWSAECDEANVVEVVKIVVKVPNQHHETLDLHLHLHQTR